MTIAGLAKNIVGSVRGLTTSLGLTSPDYRPNFPDFPNVGIKGELIQKQNWYQNPAVGTYAFAVQDIDQALKFGNSFNDYIDGITSLFSGEGSTEDFTEFSLPISPQEITQTENFAVGVRPTQGGTIVQHSGNKYKELTISGTTGVHPFKGATGADLKLGNAIFQPDELKYRSGYEVFIHFRKWVKAYHQAKAEGLPSGKPSRNLRMVFKNYKDWEFLYVEPLKFTMRRNAARPLLYDYTIQFRVIGHVIPQKPDLSILDKIDEGLLTAKNVLQTARGIILKRQDLIRSVAGEVNGLIDNLTTIALAVKAAKSYTITLADVKKQINENYLSQLQAIEIAKKISKTSSEVGSDPRTFEAEGGDSSLAPSDPVAFALSINQRVAQAQYANGKNVASPNTNAVIFLQEIIKNAGSIADQISIEAYPPNAVAQIQADVEKAALISVNEIQKIKTQVINTYNIYTDAIGFGDEIYNEIVGFTPKTEPQDAGFLTDDQFEVLFGFQQAIAGIDAILSSDELFEINAKLYSRANSASGANSIGKGVFAEVSTFTGAKEVVVPTGANLEDIALIELGDTSLWTLIADLNNLKYPYIVEENSLTVSGSVRSIGLSTPSDIKDLAIGYRFIITPQPTPSGAFLNQANTVAEYMGGDSSQKANWVFKHVDPGTVMKVLDINELRHYDGDSWVTITEEELKPEGVVKPGDVIRIPTVNPPVPSMQVRGRKDNPLTIGLTEQEKSLAVDLKLNEDFDLDLLPSGDLNVAKGSDNAAQAIILKLLYKRGSLKKFPNLGTSLSIGSKTPDLGTIRSEVFSSLMQDERIQDVRNIQLLQENNTIFLSFNVIFKTVQEPVSIQIPI